MHVRLKEQERLNLQEQLDAVKTKPDRNRLGQFATPTDLAFDIVQFGIDLLGLKRSIRFIDPAIGTGSFFSGLLSLGAVSRIVAS